MMLYSYLFDNYQPLLQNFDKQVEEAMSVANNYTKNQIMDTRF